MILILKLPQRQLCDDLQLFFNLFALPSDKLTFQREEMLVNKVKRVKKLIDLESIFLRLNKFETTEVYEILVSKSTVSSLFCEDSFNSLDDLKFLLYKHIAYFFGYSECKFSGITVRNKENKKINVEEIIYIKSSVNIKTPTLLKFVKSSKDTSKSFSMPIKIDFKTTSTILHSLLSCNELQFKFNEVSYFLSKDKDSFVMICEKSQDNIYSLINQYKEAEISFFLSKGNKEISKYFYKIFIEKNLAELHSKNLLKKILEKDLDFSWKFLCAVPIFNDNRDFVTEKIVEIYNKLNLKKQAKRKGDYLNVQERRYIDLMNFGSLKRFFYTE